MRHPTVTLLVRVRKAGTDSRGNDLREWADPVEVPGCLWGPGTPAELGGDRPDGARVTATAHFPHGWATYLRGALVSPDGESWLRVQGEPQSYPPGAVRGPWDTYVLLGRQDG